MLEYLDHLPISVGYISLPTVVPLVQENGHSCNSGGGEGPLDIQDPQISFCFAYLMRNNLVMLHEGDTNPTRSCKLSP